MVLSRTRDSSGKWPSQGQPSFLVGTSQPGVGFNLLVRQSVKLCVAPFALPRPKLITDYPPQILQYATEAIGRKKALWIIWIICTAVSW